MGADRGGANGDAVVRVWSGDDRRQGAGGMVNTVRFGIRKPTCPLMLSGLMREGKDIAGRSRLRRAW